jgi:hypothetical protein
MRERAVQEGARDCATVGVCRSVHPLLERDVSPRVPHEQHRRGRAERDDDEGADPHDGARREARRERARRERGQRDAQIAGRLVQAERESTPAWPGQVDLHHHGHRPGKSLAGAEKDVRRDDEAPVRGERDQERHRRGEQPAEDQEPLSPDAVGQAPGEEVRHRLGDAERDDEREDRRARVEVELGLADERKDAALESDHGADEPVEHDEQGELVRVRAHAEPNGSHTSTATMPARFAATIDA